jgi:putative CRISPR-associated protein (TIGR02619 family)
VNILFITVGTSGLKNDIGRAPDDRDNGALKAEIERYFADPEKRPERFSRLRSDLVDAHLRYWREVRDYTHDPRRFFFTSAELTSTVFLLESLEYKMDRIVLLSSDTNEGLFAANVNVAVLRELFPAMNPEVKQIAGLDVSFTGAQAALARVFDDYRLQKGDSVILNITGGFKGTIPFLTHFAQKNDWKLYFQHETRNSAVLLPFVTDGEPGNVKEWEAWRR